VFPPRSPPRLESPVADTLAFEPNQGQWDARVLFAARIASGRVWLTREGATVQSPSGGTLKVHLPLAPGATPETSHPLPVRSSYLIGADPSRWRTRVPAYGRVRYASTWPGVSVLFHGTAAGVEYDLELAPGADPEAIRVRLEGAQRLELSAQGELLAHVGPNVLSQPAPRTLAVTSEGVAQVAGRYVVLGPDEVGFRVDPPEPRSALIFDPVLLFSDYLGGASTDRALAVTVDSAGAIYVAGFSQSANFPTEHSLEPYAGGEDAFIAEYLPDGGALVSATYLGGSAEDEAWGIAVDDSGHAYVAGLTSSPDFPTTAGAFQRSLGAGGALDPCLADGGSVGALNAFVAKVSLGATPSLDYATLLGGSYDDEAYALAIDGKGAAYVVGYAGSTDFPTTDGGFQTAYAGCGDAFLTKVSPDGSALEFSTFLGGKYTDWLNGIALDTAGNAVVVGQSSSFDYPLQNPYQSTNKSTTSPFYNVVLSKLNAAGSALSFSTFFGGSGSDEGYGIALDAAGNVLIAGETSSSDFPHSSGSQKGQQSDAFAAKLDSTGHTLGFSEFIGGSGVDRANGLSLGTDGDVYLVGSTASGDFPVSNDALQPVFAGGAYDSFLVRLSTADGQVRYASYWGGTASDRGLAVATTPGGGAAIAGASDSTDLPAICAVQGRSGGLDDAFLAVFSFAGDGGVPCETAPDYPGLNGWSCSAAPGLCALLSALLLLLRRRRAA
jgi:hypothetical protein